MPHAVLERDVRLIFPALLVLAGCDSFRAETCRGGTCLFTAAEWERLQKLTNLPAAPADTTNAYADHAGAALLGQRFYFDRGFSGPATQLDMLKRPTPYARAAKGQPTNVSCADCHDPTRGGVDHTSNPNNVSIGAGSYDVNCTPTMNASQWQLMYWNGRCDTLWGQALGVTEGFVGMNGNRVAVARRIATDAVYRREYEAVFGLLPDLSALPANGKPGEPAYEAAPPDARAAVTRVFVNYGKALEAYERKLVSTDSAFDRFMAEGPDSDWLSLSAKRGAKLYVGKAQCLDCHSGPMFSDGQFRNIGVQPSGATVPTVTDCPKGGVCDCENGENCLPWASYDGLKKLQTATFRATGDFSDDTEARRANYERPLADALKGRWRIPSLRDVELTAPYMHNGSLATLSDVMRYYNRGGDEPEVGSKSKALVPLNLNDEELADLVAFMNSLTGARLPDSLVKAPP